MCERHDPCRAGDAGGAELDDPRCRRCMGKALYYCGPQGMGLRAKLTQNLILGNLLNAFNEGFVLSTKAGVDPELMLHQFERSLQIFRFVYQLLLAEHSQLLHFFHDGADVPNRFDDIAGAGFAFGTNHAQ